MPITRTDWDVKLVLGASTRKLRLLNTRTGKAWGVSEIPPPEIDALFSQADFSWGAGLAKLGVHLDRPGHIFRYADGYGIDTTDGIVKHGPGSASVGTVSGTVLGFIQFIDRVWILTTTKLFNWNGTTLTDFWTNPDGALNLNFVVHGTNLLVTTSRYSGGNSRYYHTNGVAAPTAVDTATTGANITMFTMGEVVWRAHSTNQITSSLTPTSAASWLTPSYTIGAGATITNLFGLTGLIFVTTRDGDIIAVNAADGTETAIDDRLKTRRSTTAYSIKSNTGTDVWLSDGSKDVLQVVALDFETFDVRPSGPFHHSNDKPFTATDTEGLVKALAQDAEFVYVAVLRGTAVYVYKGAELLRGVFAWTPIIRIASATANAMAVLKMSADTQPKLYINNGTAIVAYQIRDWTAYNTEAVITTCYFSATDESLAKMHTRMKGFIDQTGSSGITAFYRKDTETSFTNIGSSQVTPGQFKVNPTAPLANFRIQLQFVVSASDAVSPLHLRSFGLEGITKPELRRAWDFTVVADNKADADFCISLRTNTTSLISVSDRFDIVRSGTLVAWSESEMTDEITRRPARSYRLVIQEVPS